MKKGLAVFSGSDVVHKLLQDGTVVLGSGSVAPARVTVSGNVNITEELTASANQVRISNSGGSGAGYAPLTSSILSDVIVELYNNASAGASGVTLAVSGGAGSGSVAIGTGAVLSIVGTANEIETTFTDGTDTLQIGLPNDVVITNSLSASTLTASAGVAVNGGNVTVANGNVLVTGQLSASSTLSVGSTSTLAGKLTVTTGGADITGQLSASTNLLVGGNAEIVGNVTASGGLFSGDVQVNGNLLVSGSTVTLDTENLRVKDPIIVLGSGSAALTNGDRGLVFALAGGNQALGWDQDDGVFRLGSTSDNGTTTTLAITASATLELGSLVTTGSVQVGTNLTIIGGALPLTSVVSVSTGSISLSHGTVRSLLVGGQTADDNALSEMWASGSSHNGRFFYLQGTAPVNTFPRPNCWYFCQGDQWFDAPFIFEA